MAVPQYTGEKFKPLGGPDGSNGGDSDSVVLRVDRGLTTLVDYHRQSQRKARPMGSPGWAPTATALAVMTWCCRFRPARW